LFGLLEDIANLVGHRPTVHIRLSPELFSFGVVVEDIDDFLRRQGAQGFDGIRASGFRKRRAYLLRRLAAVTVFLQISHGPKRPAALADAAMNQALGRRR